MTQDEWSLAFFNQTMRVLLLCLVIVFVSCTPRGVREAQDVVALADSLREAHLVAQDEYSDSTHLAQAYYTLEKWQWLYPDDFAHACYHYGRKLRDKDNPVAAMQVFLAATHSRTHDYHILARTYSNIGDIAHLAGEFQLSYEMFEQAASNYLHNCDTLLYYYCLNDMAFELAEQGKKDSVLFILNKIETDCDNQSIIIKTLETKAVVCKKIKQYDSVLYYTSLLFSYGCYEPAIIKLRAQAYSFLGLKDSAVYFANDVLSLSSEIFEMNGALYILTHDDDEKDITAVREYSAKRADTQKLIEIRQGKLSQAVQLLEQDLTRKPDRRWLYAIIATILVLGVVNGCLVYKKRKRHQLLSQQIEDLESKNKVQTDQIRAQMEERCSVIANSPNIKEELDWYNYDHMYAIVNLRLLGILNHLQPYSLSEKEIRLCILILLKASTSQMVDMIPYAQSGLGKFKYSTARKLGTTTADMRTFLLKLACS